MMMIIRWCLVVVGGGREREKREREKEGIRHTNYMPTIPSSHVEERKEGKDNKTRQQGNEMFV